LCNWWITLEKKKSPAPIIHKAGVEDINAITNYPRYIYQSE
jgi:hypothetical protein